MVCFFIRFQLGNISRAKVCGLDEHKKKKKKKKKKKESKDGMLIGGSLGNVERETEREMAYMSGLKDIHLTRWQQSHSQLFDAAGLFRDGL